MIPDTTLQEATQQSLEHLKSKGKHPLAICTYSKDCEQIQLFFGPERPQSVGPLLVDKLLNLSNGKERKPQTVNKTVRIFS